MVRYTLYDTLCHNPYSNRHNTIFHISDLPGEHFWTGGNDLAAEGLWLWAGVGEALNYTQWLTYPHPDRGTVEQPDNLDGVEHCMHMYHLLGYDWNDSDCTNNFYAICEYDLF